MWIITNIADPQPNLQLMTFCCHYILALAASHSQVSHCLQGNMLDVEMEIGEGVGGYGVQGAHFRE